ncbi:hypothetical protein F2Q70_00029302 [Brassica cretica]|uniref:Uncharacterized protein n=1 Tax=Brassica cretica TaxID=69181 RepID=A0A8S9FHF8_BRACR|nr:hypothetical protein F2Q70_00029302 [Brassica cretica]
MTPPLSLWLSSTMKSLYLCGSLSTMNHSASLSVALLDDEKLLSLSRWLSSAKNHSTSLSVILCTEDSNFAEDTPAERRERRKWTPIDDVVLNSLWLNTSKDPVAAYFAANPKVTGCEHRESSHYDQGTNRPPGVKAAKGHGKKTKVEGKALSALSEFQSLEKVKE